MAASTKKRKIGSNEPINAPVSKTKRAKGAQSGFAEPQREPSQDLFRKLPGELRNRIYELVFTPNKFRRSRPNSQPPKELTVVRYRRSIHWSLERTYYPKWNEPGLLRAAKWIRQEAKLLYYRSARIAISVKSDEVGEVCAWLRAITAGDVDKSLRHVKIHLRSVKIDDIHSWLPLAQLFSDYDMGHTPNAWGWGRGVERFVTYGVATDQAQKAMEAVTAMGVQARTQNWGHEYLQIIFEDWIAAQIPKARRNLPHNFGLTKEEEKYWYRQGSRTQRLRRQLADGISPLQRKMNEQLQCLSHAEDAKAGRYQYRGSKIEHRGKLQMTLRSRKAAGTRSR
ncbi:hypothetical protein LTS10_007140 [Elasticomyces elasticus]|nr:hypothetical protein LTS10_007140 [Elasticomyces elasticus]